jgi:hypothetical protein
MQQAIKLEQMVVEKLRSLPLEKQQEVLDFVEFLEQKKGLLILLSGAS